MAKLIALRAGHTLKCRGSHGFIDETEEARKVVKSIRKYLEAYGQKYIMCQPDENISSESKELYGGIEMANNSKADYFVSIHFNAFEETSNKMGTECYVYSFHDLATRINANLVQLGFKDRGVKISNKLAELKKTRKGLKATIVEVCFVDSKGDTELYKEVGYDKVGKAIAQAIVNSQTDIDTSHKGEVSEVNRKGTFVITTETLNIRALPTTESEKVGVYYRNESVVFDKIISKDNYKWVSWIAYSGKRRYMAIENLISGKKYGYIK